jgi:hypothetical protein
MDNHFDTKCQVEVIDALVFGPYAIKQHENNEFMPKRGAGVAVTVPSQRCACHDTVVINRDDTCVEPPPQPPGLTRKQLRKCINFITFRGLCSSRLCCSAWASAK